MIPVKIDVDWRTVAVAGVVAIAAYLILSRDAAAVLAGAAGKVGDVVKGAGNVVKKTVEGVVFRKSTLGPKTGLTVSQKTRLDKAIIAGYVREDSAGRIFITAKGERLIASGVSMSTIIP